MTAKRNLLWRLANDCQEKPAEQKQNKYVARPFSGYCRTTACNPSHSHAKAGWEIYTIIRTSPADRQGGPWSRYGVCVDVYVLGEGGTQVHMMVL